ncbi:DUF975 family protein [Sinanaerobacter chloroacetimidivorans]|jgi:uncharacterized membrane protein|uniref:DUF975 family protein n=1 Tax=Sinanaerobacter chloroacetimidivorans TaxID=2818044 RepID=A0A8J8B3A0_9FIRM|nr:DUF975 family protein [Sinanaerobacter chloroacetimidivorans]MBR0600144.1 DUF975 family protein [Sinanaerobacter chloroacetimidivorans]
MDNNIIVNESCKTLRALGRESLQNRWGFAALGTLLYMILILVPVLVLDLLFGPEDGSGSGISAIYSLLVTGPMSLGYAMFGISLFRKRETSVAEVFYGFEKFGKALGLYIVMSIFIFLWTLLLIIPGIIAAYRYSLCFFILADNPNIGIMDAIRESKRMMRGNKWKMFCLMLSFIGWGILCIFTLGIGTLWLSPYMQVSVVAFYDIARGSLRARRIDDGFYKAPEIQPTEDPITVYKEEAEGENKEDNNEFKKDDNEFKEDNNES